MTGKAASTNLFHQSRPRRGGSSGAAGPAGHAGAGPRGVERDGGEDSRPSPTQLVCFDLGRVLIRIRDGWDGACEALGLAPLSTLDPQRQAAVLAAAKRHEVGASDAKAFAHETAMTLGLEREMVLKVLGAWLCEPFPGVFQLIDELSRANAATACLSNTNDHHWRLITTPDSVHRLPLERLDYRFASHLIGFAKPDAAIYEHVERQTGVQPERIVFFDDMRENIEAARRRGWRAHRIHAAADPVTQMDAHLRRYDVLPAPSPMPTVNDVDVRHEVERSESL